MDLRKELTVGKDNRKMTRLAKPVNNPVAAQIFEMEQCLKHLTNHHQTLVKAVSLWSEEVKMWDSRSALIDHFEAQGWKKTPQSNSFSEFDIQALKNLRRAAQVRLSDAQETLEKRTSQQGNPPAYSATPTVLRGER